MRCMIMAFLFILIPIVSGACIDIDRDGYGLSGDCPYKGYDCNDTLPNVFPGSQEICNSIDDDCNGVVDDIFGYKDTEITKCGCTGGTPPRTEVCNQIDDNCNGRIDENCSYKIAPAATTRAASKLQSTQNILVSLMVLAAVLGILVYSVAIL
ncbi:MAG: hypothetical protein DRG59_13815, partial [Deltaproteobacteria bacterium]